MTTNGSKGRAQVKGGNTGGVPALVATSNRLGCNPWAVGVPELLFFFFFISGVVPFFFSLEAVRAQRGATTRTGRRKSHPQQQSPSSKVPAAKSQRLSRERKKVTKVSPGHSFPLIVEFFSGNRSWTLPSPVAASAVCSHQPSAISHRTRRGPRRVTLWRAAVPWRTRSAHVVTQADLGRFPEAIALSLFGPVCLAQFPCFFSFPSFLPSSAIFQSSGSARLPFFRALPTPNRATCCACFL